MSLTVNGTGPGQRYGFRADGPWDRRSKRLLFDPSKLLVDPHATWLDGRFLFDPRLALRGLDTAALVPKAVVAAPAGPVNLQPPLFTPAD